MCWLLRRGVIREKPFFFVVPKFSLISDKSGFFCCNLPTENWTNISVKYVSEKQMYIHDVSYSKDNVSTRRLSWHTFRSEIKSKMLNVKNKKHLSWTKYTIVGLFWCELHICVHRSLRGRQRTRFLFVRFELANF